MRFASKETTVSSIELSIGCPWQTAVAEVDVSAFTSYSAKATVVAESAAGEAAAFEMEE